MKQMREQMDKMDSTLSTTLSKFEQVGILRLKFEEEFKREHGYESFTTEQKEFIKANAKHIFQ